MAPQKRAFNPALLLSALVCHAALEALPPGQQCCSECCRIHGYWRSGAAPDLLEVPGAARAFVRSSNRGNELFVVNYLFPSLKMAPRVLQVRTENS